MSRSLSIFDNYVIKEFCNTYKIKKELLKENIYYFRYFCFKMNFFIKSIVLPPIQKESLYEAVFIEFREFPHIEFIIRNAILKLGIKWSHTIICGKTNYSMVKNIANSISPFIKIIKLNVVNMTQSEYSRLLMTKDFWESLKGEKIFIHQEDSLIFKDNIDEFTEYDYIGAPFPKHADDTPNSVGNGGLSIRTKKIMLDIISKFDYKTYPYNSSTLLYMANVKLDCPPEDVYFSKCMQENYIGHVADWNTAYNFSTESVYNPNSFGGHKFWISNNKTWINDLKKLFKYSVYNEKSDINNYLKYLKKPDHFNKTKEIPNAFDIDLYFFCKANNFDFNNLEPSMECFKKIGLNGFLYHPKQLRNLFSKVFLYKYSKYIYITTELTPQPLPITDFVNKYLYNSSFDFFTSLLIKQIYSCLNDNFNTIFLVFIGNEQIGIELLKSIIEYKNKVTDKFNISFCFNSSKILKSPHIKELIKNNFDYYSIYKCRELGTDITPTLLMYNEIVKKHNFEHIYKFHTKRISKNYIELTEYLLSKPLTELIKDKSDIGHPSYYLSLQNDEFNNNLKYQHNSKIDTEKGFVAGTIFYTNNIVFNKVVDFVKQNNYRSYILNSLYENNSINKEFSPIHFLERLFGIIRL